MLDDEREWVRQAADGSREAFGHLVQRYRRQICAHCRRFLCHEEDAEDIAQQTFLKAWNNLKNFRGDSSVATWLYKIATNECKGRLRRRGCPTTSLEQAPEQADPAPPMEKREIPLQMLEALRRALSPEDYTIVGLYYGLELSSKEVGELIGMNPNTVRSHVHRIKKAVEEIAEEFKD